jgi:polyisoprenoid-binding protein YceI
MLAAVSRRLKFLACAIVLVVALGGAGLWWFLRDDAPAAVDLDTAAESVQPADGETESAADGADGVEGSWTVDTETGDFDYESATGTFAGFRVDEELSSIGSTTAVGRTGDVSGSIEIDGTTLTSAEFEVDLTTITTNESRRDDQVQEALDTGEYPTATFTLTEPLDLGDAAATGDAVDVTATGDLTIHGVTRPVEIPLQARLVNDTVVVVGSLDLTFSDYEVEVPQSPVVLSVDDQGTLELQLLLTRS